MSNDVTVKLADATAAQLRYFAEIVLGLSLGPNPAIKTETLIAKIMSTGYQRDDITVPASVGGDAASQASAADTPAHAVDPGSYQRGPRASILIERQEGPGGDRDVFVAVNGKSMLIPRGKPCAVGLPYVEALQHAVQTLYNMEEDGSITSREVPLYLMRILSMPAAA
ncbi:hypothetical protein D3877_11985 [Azospirillum cavernae]|uniref:Uncharacterized protein n=1 Tax=Azospirillum cavernae TaxID=2320860 RepID=A0A418VUW2_9PROT|nr:hypothetical protein [Azospirillum cavernae]RJF80948.1 hypothetical protein D3877_11985 [Azospirillum cavernae]